MFPGQLGDESDTDVDSDTDGSIGKDLYDGEDRDVLDRELHTLAKEGINPYSCSFFVEHLIMKRIYRSH